ncbi:MAG: hypothetical protein ABS81_15410 [Pseudonocardia sp. SCN 72-86]|nr:MAG: hypothetical protein ABS81_15410 [Pseudonocardia sp. SCN 72-86]
MGDGSTTHRDERVQVPGLDGVVAIGAGYAHSVALKGDGSVWTWGSNIYGCLGIGDGTDEAHEPQRVPIDGVVAIQMERSPVRTKIDRVVLLTGGRYHTAATGRVLE